MGHLVFGHRGTLRTVPTNSKVFLPQIYDYSGKLYLNKCY